MKSFAAKAILYASIGTLASSHPTNTTNDVIERKYTDNLFHSGFYSEDSCQALDSDNNHDQTERLRIIQDMIMQVGGQFNNIDLYEFEPGSHGIIATRPIEKGELIAFFPQSVLIPQEPMNKIQSYNQLQQHGRIERDEHCHDFMLLLHIMEERRNPVSQFSEYISLLSTDSSKYPLFYSDEDLDWLQGSSFLQQITQTKKTVQFCYDLMADSIPDFGSEHSLQEFTETHQAIQSRKIIFGVKSSTKIVPFMDMFDTGNQGQVQIEWREAPKRSGFVVHATQDIAQGEQIYQKYREKTNQDLLMNHGFFDINNTKEFKINLTLELKPQMDHFEIKTDILGSSHILFDVNRVPSQEMLSIARIAFFYDTENIEELVNIKDTYLETNVVPPFNVKSELFVMRRIIKLCQFSLQSYPRTLEGDKALLKRDDITLNQRNALLMTIREKQTLHSVIEFSEKIADLLMADKSDQEKFLKDRQALQKLPKAMKKYIMTEIAPLIRKESHC